MDQEEKNIPCSGSITGGSEDVMVSQKLVYSHKEEVNLHNHETKDSNYKVVSTSARGCHHGYFSRVYGDVVCQVQDRRYLSNNHQDIHCPQDSTYSVKALNCQGHRVIHNNPNESGVFPVSKGQVEKLKSLAYMINTQILQLDKHV
jgi:hypothetical protein